MAVSVEARHPHPHGHRILARPARENLCAEQDREPATRLDRMARRRRVFLCLRRWEGDGQGCARDPGARLCRREIAFAGSGRSGGGELGARQALPAGYLLILLQLEGQWLTKSRATSASRKRATICAARWPRACARKSPARSSRTISNS